MKFSLLLAMSFFVSASVVQAAPSMARLTAADYHGEDMIQFLKNEGTKSPVLNPHVLLFLNLNLNPKEALAVQRVAQAKGQRLIAFPDTTIMTLLQNNYLKIAELNDRKTILRLQRIEWSERQRKSISAAESAKLEKMMRDAQAEIDHQKEFERADIENESFKLACAHFGVKIQAGESAAEVADRAYKAALARLLNELKLNHSQIETLVVSGHNAEDLYGELTFGFQRMDGDKTSVFDFYRKIAHMSTSLTTIALWGCDALNEEVVKHWVKVAPNFQVMLGYSGAAPHGNRPQSYAFLEQGLIQVPQLLATTTGDELKKTMIAIPGVENTAAALVVRTKALGDLFISTEVEGSEVHLTRSITDLKKMLDCEAIKPKIESQMAMLKPYFDGKAPLPADEASSQVKQAYFFLHHHSECLIGAGQPYETFQVGLLRFFETDVKFNIAKALEKNIIAAENEIKNSKRTTAHLKAINFSKLLTETDRGQILKTLHSIKILDADAIPKTSALLEALDRLVVELDPSCMPMNRWHQRSESALPIACNLSQ